MQSNNQVVRQVRNAKLDQFINDYLSKIIQTIGNYACLKTYCTDAYVDDSFNSRNKEKLPKFGFEIVILYTSKRDYGSENESNLKPVVNEFNFLLKRFLKSYGLILKNELSICNKALQLQGEDHHYEVEHSYYSESGLVIINPNLTLTSFRNIFKEDFKASKVKIVLPNLIKELEQKVVDIQNRY